MFNTYCDPDLLELTMLKDLENCLSIEQIIQYR